MSDTVRDSGGRLRCRLLGEGTFLYIIPVLFLGGLLAKRLGVTLVLQGNLMGILRSGDCFEF